MSSFFTSSKKAVFSGLIWFMINYIAAVMVDSIEEKNQGILIMCSFSPFAAVKLASAT